MFYIFMVIGITALCIVYLIELDRNDKLERELKTLQDYQNIHTRKIRLIHNEIIGLKSMGKKIDYTKPIIEDMVSNISAAKEKEINIKYFSEDYPRLKKIEKGDWIDLRVDSIKGHNEFKVNDRYWEYCPYKKGDIIKFGLGVAMELPEGYEAVVLPRSSTFKNWGFIQTNSQGVIDNSYNGNNDEWQIEFIAMKDGEINRFDRVCQFRIQKNQPNIRLNEVDKLENEDRGGYGTTGK